MIDCGAGFTGPGCRWSGWTNINLQSTPFFTISATKCELSHNLLCGFKSTHVTSRTEYHHIEVDRRLQFLFKVQPLRWETQRPDPWFVRIWPYVSRLSIVRTVLHLSTTNNFQNPIPQYPPQPNFSKHWVISIYNSHPPTFSKLWYSTQSNALLVRLVSFIDRFKSVFEFRWPNRHQTFFSVVCVCVFGDLGDFLSLTKATILPFFMLCATDISNLISLQVCLVTVLWQEMFSFSCFCMNDIVCLGSTKSQCHLVTFEFHHCVYVPPMTCKQPKSSLYGSVGSWRVCLTCDFSNLWKVAGLVGEFVRILVGDPGSITYLRNSNVFHQTNFWRVESVPVVHCHSKCTLCACLMQNNLLFWRSTTGMCVFAANLPQFIFDH